MGSKYSKYAILMYLVQQANMVVGGSNCSKLMEAMWRLSITLHILVPNFTVQVEARMKLTEAFPSPATVCRCWTGKCGSPWSHRVQNFGSTTFIYFLYGAEMWSIIKAIEKRIEIFNEIFPLSTVVHSTINSLFYYKLKVKIAYSLMYTCNN